MAGMRAFERGGNAADAALAAAAVLAVVEPNQSGLGGDLFALVVSDNAAPVGLNASGRAPADPGDLLPAEFGPTSVTVPGCVSGWTELAGRYARLGLGAAIEPAVELAQRGFTVAPRNLEIWMSDWGRSEGAAAEQFTARDPFQNPEIDQSLLAAADGSLTTQDAAVRRSWPDRGLRNPTSRATPTTGWSRSSSSSAGTRCSSYRPNGQGSIPGWALEALTDDLSPACRSRRWRQPTRAATPPSAARRMCAPPTAAAWASR